MSEKTEIGLSFGLHSEIQDAVIPAVTGALDRRHTVQDTQNAFYTLLEASVRVWEVLQDEVKDTPFAETFGDLMYVRLCCRVLEDKREASNPKAG